MALSREQMDIVLSARDQTGAAFTSARRNLGGLSRDVAMLRTTVLGIVGIAGIAQLPRLIGSVISETSGIAKAADRIGITAERLQELHHSAKLADVSTSDLDSSMQQFTKRLGEAAASKTNLTKILAANNVALRNADGTIRPVNDLLSDYADLIKNAKSEQDRMVLATEAFGRSGMTMVNVLKGGRDGLRENAAEARRLGLVIDGDLVRSAEQVNDQWTRFSGIVATEFKRAVLNAVGGIRDANEELEAFAKTLGTVFNAIANNITLFERFIGAYVAMRLFGIAGRPGKIVGAGIGFLTPEIRKLLGITLEDESAGTAPRPQGVPTTPSPGAPSLPGRPTVVPRFNRDESQIQRILELLDVERQKLTLNVEELRKAERAQMEINLLRQAGTGATEADKQAIRAKVALLFEEKAAFEKLKRAVEAYNEALRFSGEMAVDALEALILRGEKAEDVMRRLALQLARAALQAALLGQGPLAGILGLANPTGGVGGLLRAIFNPLAPGRADGGPVRAGMPYWVGERGRPELFIPDRDGVIVPERQVRRAGRGERAISIHAPVTVITPDAPSFNRSRGEVSRTVGRSLQRAARFM